MKTSVRKFVTVALSVCSMIFSDPAFARGRLQNADFKSLSDLETAYGTITGNLSTSTACIASPSSTAGLYAGQYVYDQTTASNLNYPTTVVGIPGTCSAGQIQISANAAGTAT